MLVSDQTIHLEKVILGKPNGFLAIFIITLLLLPNCLSLGTFFVFVNLERSIMHIKLKPTYL